MELSASCSLLLLFIPREVALHNDYSVLVYFYKVGPFPLMLSLIYSLMGNLLMQHVSLAVQQVRRI